MKQQSASRYVAPHGHIILVPSKSVFDLTPYCCMISKEAINNKFSVIGLTRSLLEPTIYPTRGEYANDYTTDAVRTGFNVHLCFYSPGCKTTITILNLFTQLFN